MDYHMDVFKIKYNQITGYIYIVNVITGVVVEDKFKNWSDANEVVTEMNHNLRMGMLG